ncbi:MAG: hypothetical protein QOD61_1981, partial [Solirubrobacteraceae bacterium]|nr:hypothetical protein [Solirubrobacteraceae bacterium]
MVPEQSLPRRWSPVIAVSLAVALALVLAGPAAARGRLLGLVARTVPAAGLSDTVPPPRAAAPAAASGNVSYQGGPVMHAHQTFLIFWDPGQALTADFKSRVARYLTDVGQDSGTQTNVYAVPTEYGDASGSVGYRSSFGGAYTDTSPVPLSSCSQGGLNLFPAPCLTDAGIQAEIATDLRANGWSPGLDRAYFLLTPAGLESCSDTTSGLCSTNAFCAYHSQLDPAAYPSYPDTDPVVYGYIPWGAVSGCQAPQSPNGSDADATVNLMSHEHIEMLTDPIVDQPAWTDPDGTEIADKCRTSYAPVSGAPGTEYNQTINGDRYILQNEWSNAHGACIQRAAANQPPVPAFTAATADGLQFSFDGSASTDPDGRVLSYAWDFGDGQSASTPQVSHAYAGSGTRTVTLTVTDNAGGSGLAAQIVQVGSPSPPTTTPPPPTTTPP